MTRLNSRNVFVAVTLASSVLVACGDDPLQTDAGSPGEEASVPSDTLTVEVGVPGGHDGLDFVEFERGGDFHLETFGQGGTHVTVAVRVHGLGVNRAFLDVTLFNLDTDARAMTAPSSRPQLWYCEDDFAVCTQARVFVMTGGLAPPNEKDGLPVRVTAVVTATDGRIGSGSTEGVLRDDLKDAEGPQRDAAVDAGGEGDDAGGG